MAAPPLAAQRFARVGKQLLPHGCKHRPEHVVQTTDSYNDGGLRIVVHEWFCSMCNHVVRREWGTCDMGRRVHCAAMWD